MPQINILAVFAAGLSSMILGLAILTIFLS